MASAIISTLVVTPNGAQRLLFVPFESRLSRRASSARIAYEVMITEVFRMRNGLHILLAALSKPVQPLASSARV